VDGGIKKDGKGVQCMRRTKNQVWKVARMVFRNTLIKARFNAMKE